MEGRPWERSSQTIGGFHNSRPMTTGPLPQLQPSAQGLLSMGTSAQPSIFSGGVNAGRVKTASRPAPAVYGMNAGAGLQPPPQSANGFGSRYMPAPWEPRPLSGVVPPSRMGNTSARLQQRPHPPATPGAGNGAAGPLGSGLSFSGQHHHHNGVMGGNQRRVMSLNNTAPPQSPHAALS